MKEPNYFFDEKGTRLELVQTLGGRPYNWLFFPGGPGADSSYFHSLVELLDLPGNVWLIDLPGSGGNVQEGVDYDQWYEIFPALVKRFENPVVVGHSFGGMFPLLFSEMENLLKGLIILNSSPKLCLEEAVKYSKQFDLPDLSKEMAEFTANPSQETFDVALDACMPYYFPKETLEQGRQMLLKLPFQYRSAVWWQRKAIETNYSAKWIPQNVPTLIVGSKHDCICPHTLFESDERFKRDNIETSYLDDAGHIIWLENPKKTKELFDGFVYRLS